MPHRRARVRESNNRHGGIITQSNPSTSTTSGGRVSRGGGGGGSSSSSSSSSHRGRENILGVGRLSLGGLVRGLVILTVTVVALSQGSADSEYLADFFYALDGPDWVDNTSWTNDSVVLEDWAGITTTVDGNGTECVRFLDLTGNNLVGTIPDVGEGQLECLQRLKLGENTITGGMPAGLSNLQGLFVLELDQNGLTGGIPAELGSLPALADLHLGENALSGSIPPELGNLGNLQELNLESNAFDGIIPPELGNLETLQHLHLSGNSLIGLIPETFGNLLSLKSLYLAGNDLAGTIPEELGTLVEDGGLGEVDLSNNFLTGDIPEGLTQLYPGSLDLDGNLMVCCDSDNALVCCEPRADDDTETAPPYPTPAPMTPSPTSAPLLFTPAPSTKAPTPTPTPAPIPAVPPIPANLSDSGDSAVGPSVGTGGGNGGDLGEEGTDGGTIAGIVIGTGVGAAALGLLGVCCYRRRRRRRRRRRDQRRGEKQRQQGDSLPVRDAVGGGGGGRTAAVTGTRDGSSGGGGGGGGSGMGNTANGVPPLDCSSRFASAGDGGNSNSNAGPRQFPSEMTHPGSPADAAPIASYSFSHLGVTVVAGEGGGGGGGMGSSGPPEAGANAPASPADQAPPPWPPRHQAADSSREKSSDSGGGRSSDVDSNTHASSNGFNTHASSPFHSASSAHNNNSNNNNNSSTFNSTSETELWFHPLAPLVSASYSGIEVNAAPAMDSELDVKLGSPRRGDGPYPYPDGHVNANGDGCGDRDPFAAPAAAEAATVGGPGGRLPVSVTYPGPAISPDRSQSISSGGTGPRRAPAASEDDPRSKSEEVTRPRQREEPSSPPPPYELIGPSAPLPADAEADQRPSWDKHYPRVPGIPVAIAAAEMVPPPDRVGGGSGESSGQSDRRASSLFGSGSGRRLDAVLAVAKRMSSAAQNSSIAGVPEVAMLVESLVTLSADNRNNAAAFDTSLKLCENLGMVLDQAESLLQKDPGSDAGRKLLEGVQVEVRNVVEVMEAYKRKKRWKQIWKASIYRKRVEEAEDAVTRMLAFVHTALQGQSLAETRALGENMARLEQSLQQDLAFRRKKREQELIREETIPEDDIEIHLDLVIGSGGAGEVYMANYAGVNAAAKVVKIGGEGHKAEQQRKFFLTEVRNMRRLNKSPRVARVYGIVTTRPSEHVLVMEYMSGGDLFSFIKKHRDEGLSGFSEELTRNLINDVAQGLAYLHQHDTWHGDLKSLNVLLDAENRAKISDFGASHWTKETASKCFLSQVPEMSLNQFSFHWAAPEILQKGSPSVQLRAVSHSSGLSQSEHGEVHARVVSQSFMSDVYSFGIVVWEVLSREVPWEDLEGSEIYRRVRIVGDRPTMPASAPPDLAELARACWRREPESRLTCDQILAHLGGFRAPY